MRADSAISGSLRLEVVAVASCWAGKRRGDGQPSWRFIEDAILTQDLLEQRMRG